jgi:hypothetical protein
MDDNATQHHLPHRGRADLDQFGLEEIPLTRRWTEAPDASPDA